MTVAVLLILVGAVSKSALFPFHFWLPAAMAAPTPVSAYLHAAAMVKAGVYLVALLAPAFAGVPGWRGLLLPLGLFTMLLGGWRALRQFDIKLLLAYGTVSQLGFLLVVVSIGTRAAALAGVAMLVAHALFKATLFLVVGIVDHQAGTRDLRELSGVGRSAPALAVVAVVAGGVDGRPAAAGRLRRQGERVRRADRRRAAGEGTGLDGVAGWTWSVGVVLGSALTVAYTARFLWGAFATKPDTARTEFDRIPAGFLAAPVLLAASSLVLGFLGGPETTMLDAVRRQLPRRRARRRAGAVARARARPGAVAGLSGPRPAAVLAPAVCSRRCSRPSAWLERRTRRTSTVDAAAGPRGGRGHRPHPARLGGDLPQRDPGGRRAAARARRCSPPGTARPEVVGWDNGGQVVVAVIIVVAAVLTARSRRRLKAVVMVGVTGYGTAMLFLLHGAPDLALTQVLVETVTLVVFVLVLRRLPEYFTDRPLSPRRYWRMALGAAVAAAVAGVMVVATGARTATPVSAAFPEEAVAFGGGRNIVNVTLVDIRAWDTMGEIAVLVAARHRGRQPGLPPHPQVVDPPSTSTTRSGSRRAAAGRRAPVWLAGGPHRSPRSGARSSSRWSPGWSSTPSWCSRSTCCSPGTTAPAAGSPPAWSPAWRWWCATSPAAGTSSTRRHRSTPAR